MFVARVHYGSSPLEIFATKFEYFISALDYEQALKIKTEKY